MNSSVKKKVLILALSFPFIYLLDSLVDHTWSLSYGTIRTWLLVVLIVAPVLFKEKFRAKKWQVSILFAIIWAIAFPLLAYLMGSEFTLIRALLMGLVGFANTYLQLRENVTD